MKRLFSAQSKSSEKEKDPYFKVPQRIVNPNPLKYDGIEDIVILDDWVKSMDKLLIAIKYPADQ